MERGREFLAEIEGTGGSLDEESAKIGKIEIGTNDRFLTLTFHVIAEETPGTKQRSGSVEDGTEVPFEVSGDVLGQVVKLQESLNGERWATVRGHGGYYPSR